MNDCPHQATTPELLDLLDGFLRTDNGVADSLRDYLHTTTAERPDRPGYDANLVIDLVGLTAHALRNHPPLP